MVGQVLREHVYFSNNSDQRLNRQDRGLPPGPITPVPTGVAADALRYADGVVDYRRGRMVCVREDHSDAGEAITTLVGVDFSGATAPKVFLSGNDFYSTPQRFDEFSSTITDNFRVIDPKDFRILA